MCFLPLYHIIYFVAVSQCPQRPLLTTLVLSSDKMQLEDVCVWKDSSGAQPLPWGPGILPSFRWKFPHHATNSVQSTGSSRHYRYLASASRIWVKVGRYMNKTPKPEESVLYRIILPLFGKRLQDLSEGGPAVGGGGREVGPAVHRLQSGGQENAQGPATAPRRSLQNICGFFLSQ